MDEQRLMTLAALARCLPGDYGIGYRRGLRRLRYGEGIFTAGPSARLMRLGRDDDPRGELAQGYRDALAAKAPCWPEVGAEHAA